ncbi:cuticle protein AMP1A-like [Penaeus chinensis]|uniref:cuticle protein AMP1A-like n=1 Tax=Penaeus chinensis TaxID=139456 RepID=UPI001FB8476A|nr:cuticle protein AMP1A-like [Penaeus chinensis]
MNESSTESHVEGVQVLKDDTTSAETLTIGLRTCNKELRYKPLQGSAHRLSIRKVPPSSSGYIIYKGRPDMLNYHSFPSAATMKTIVFACLIAVAVAAPQLQEREVVLLRDDRIANEDGTFSYALEADNGIKTAVEGVVGSAGQINQAGSYTLTLEDGTQAVVNFIANENGFQPQSNILPTPHPLPAHVYELLEIAERQRAEGIVFN